MPSREPCDTTIDTFVIGVGCASAGGSGRAAGVGSTVAVMASLLRYSLLVSGCRRSWGRALRGPLGGGLGGPLGEELIELFDRDAGILAERADRGSGAALQVGLPHEANHEPV